MKNKLLFIFIIILILLVVFNKNYMFQKLENNEDFRKVFFKEANNAVVVNIWIEEPGLDNLRKHEIKYLFVDIGNTNKDGRVITPDDEIISFLNLIKNYESENNYDFIILAYSEINTYNYDFDSINFRENFIQDYKTFLELGFDGLLIDVEPVQFSQREIFLEFLDKLNNKLPGNSLISVYSGFISNDENENENEWEWNFDFYKKVSNKVDLISFPLYDTDLSDKDEYQSFVKDQIRILSSYSTETDILLAIPTHKQQPEIIENALQSYNEEIKINKGSIIGVTIFADWTTDENEWKVFEEYF